MDFPRDKNLHRNEIPNLTLPGGCRIDDLLEDYVTGVQRSLDANLVGIHLRGSLAMGDVLESSDIDLLVATECPIAEKEAEALFAFHAEFVALPHPYATRVETAYIDRVALKRYTPGLSHLTLEQGEGETLKWHKHGASWVFERWTIREHGVALLGPDAKHLIAPISSTELKDATRARLEDWLEWANTPDDPDWSLPDHHKAYVVETMCRALYTLKRGEMMSKPQAVQWALESLNEPWRSTVVRSQVWRQREWSKGLLEPEINEEVRRFILWVAHQGKVE